jgi:hypothetical protein
MGEFLIRILCKTLTADMVGNYCPGSVLLSKKTDAELGPKCAQNGMFWPITQAV